MVYFKRLKTSGSEFGGFKNVLRDASVPSLHRESTDSLISIMIIVISKVL